MAGGKGEFAFIQFHLPSDYFGNLNERYNHKRKQGILDGYCSKNTISVEV